MSTILTADQAYHYELFKQAAEDPDNVQNDQPLTVVAERVVDAFARQAEMEARARLIAEYEGDCDRLQLVRFEAEGARRRARKLLLDALIQQALWHVRGPICRKCEVMERLGTCRCDPAANE